MLWCMRIVLGVGVCSVTISAVVDQTLADKSKATVELRWVEVKRIEGLTEETGFQSSCDPKSVVYPHKKPALVLTGAEIAKTNLTKHNFVNGGLSSDNYIVTLHLTKEARDKLAASCESEDTSLLTVVVDGKYWGVHRYEKDKHKPLVPRAARAETFTLRVGFFSATEGKRLADALND